jgi:hypothetical protein
MNPIQIFISNVQSEFVEERKALFDYLTTDVLLAQFFVPFLFEKLPAVDRSANEMYLDEVANCDIYLGLFGQQYGREYLTSENKQMTSESKKIAMISGIPDRMAGIWRNFCLRRIIG